MTAGSLLIIVAIAAACSAPNTNGSGDVIPTLTVADTLFRATEDWTVMGAEVGPGGVVFVADFARLGVHVRGLSDSNARVFGRAGDGPGEFRFLHRLIRCGTVVLAHDFVHGTLTPVTPDGLGTDEQLPVSLRLTEFLGCDGNGRRYFTGVPGGRVSPGQQLLPMLVLRHTPPAHAIDTVVVLDGTEVYVSSTAGAFREVPFGRQSLVGVGPSGVVYTNSSRSELLAITETGRRQTLYSTKPMDREVTAQDRELHVKERLLTEPDSGGRVKLLAVLAEAEWGERLPQWDRLIAGSDGTFWVRRTPAHTDTAATWLAVASNGRDVETLLLPRQMRMVSADAGYLTVVQDQATGEEHVMVLRLTRPE